MKIALWRNEFYIYCSKKSFSWMPRFSRSSGLSGGRSISFFLAQTQNFSLDPDKYKISVESSNAIKQLYSNKNILKFQNAQLYYFCNLQIHCWIWTDLKCRSNLFVSKRQGRKDALNIMLSLFYCFESIQLFSTS
jgi:hypothetical protein